MNPTGALAGPEAAIDSLAVAAAPAMLPLVDLGGDHEQAVAAIAAACETWGMFQITGHGVDPGLIEACLEQIRRFFGRQPADKQRLSRTLDNPWGYYDRELTKNVPDRKEVFDIGPERVAPEDPFVGRIRWPAGDATFRRTMVAYAEAMEALSARLVGMVAAGLGEAADALEPAFCPAPTSFLRLNSYPVATGAAPGRAVHHHSDAGALTVLLEDGTPGLQVLHAGQWHDVAPRAGTLVVNIGDMVQVWSNDRYPAPLHRVLAMTERQRFSAPYFYNPAYGAVIAPLSRVAAQSGGPCYCPIPWSEFRRRRAQGDYGDYGKEVQIGDYAA